MLVILGFLLTIFFGLLLTLLIVPKMYPLERLGVSYVLGLGLLTLLMFFYSLAGYKFNLLNTLITLSLPTLILLLLTRKRIGPFIAELKAALSFSQFSTMGKIIVMVIGFFVLYSLMSTLYWPVHSWDALVVYDFRAKMFASIGTLGGGLIGKYYFGYPFLTSLAHIWVYLLGGSNPLFIYTLFLIAFVAMFYEALREFVSKTLCFVAVFFLVTTPALLGHSTFAYTNLPYTVYFVMGTIYLYIWMAKQKRGYLILSALMVGLSTWTRSYEPFWLVNLGILILYSLVKRKFLAPILYSLIFFPIQQQWLVYQSKNLHAESTVGRVTKSISILTTKIDFSRMGEVALYLFHNVINSWQPLLTLFLVVIFLELKKGRKEVNYFLLLLILTNFLLLVLGIYIASFTYPEWRDIPDSVTRLSMFFLPLFLFYVFSSRVIQQTFHDGRKKT